MTKTFDEDANYPKLVEYCEANGLKIGHVINTQIKNFLEKHNALK
jgi:hypothetical protein